MSFNSKESQRQKFLLLHKSRVCETFILQSRTVQKECQNGFQKTFKGCGVMRRRTYQTIVASSARPLSTQLYILRGENYTHPWQLKPSKAKNRYSLYKGSKKMYNVVFLEEIATPMSVKKLSGRFVSSERRRRR